MALLLALTIALLNGIVVRFAMNTINSTFAAVNDETDPDNSAPSRRCAPAGPGRWSTGSRWATRAASSSPPDRRSRISPSSTADRPIEPIRAYAGLNSADGIKATAALAARELQRTGGLDRAVVAVATTTGTGWINEAEASALEYMYNGDTAIVSMQYSFLPSWLSFLVDKENARQAGQALFEAVDELVRRDARGNSARSWSSSVRASVRSAARRRSWR